MGIVEFFVNSAFAILFLPLWIILIIMCNAAIPFVSSKKLTLNLTVGTTIINILFAAVSMFYCMQVAPHGVVEKNMMWLNSGGLQIASGMLVDSAASLIFLVASIVALILQVYSFSEFKQEKEFHRFYILLNLLNFAIAGIIFASNAVQTYIFWEIAGVVAYFLMGFWYKRKSATDAALKAFLFGKFGDIAFFGGIIVLIYFAVVFPTANNMILLSYDNISFTAETLYSMVSERAYAMLAMLPIIGVLVRMAQFPFQVWMSDSTETPISVSAILQGLLPLVTGGFVLMRLYPLIILSNTVTSALIIVGIVSALIFAYVAMSQNNIKKLLAYSTSSQLGFVVVGFGIGAYSGAIHYLVAHSLAKVLLILTAGMVIKAMNNENDIKYFGGLREKLPLCAVSFLVGVLSISGLTFSGFFPAKAVLTQVFDYGNSWLVVACLAGLFMTVFYLFRAYFLIFEGEQRFNFELQSVSLFNKIPTALLALICAGGIFAGDKINNFIYFITPEKVMPASAVQLTVMLFVALCTIYIAFGLYVTKNNRFVLIKESLLCKENLPYKLSYNNFYMEQIYKFLLDKLFLRFCRLIDFVDKYIINGIVVLVALGTRIISYIRSKMQNGNVQTYVLYAFWLIGFVMLVIAAMYILGSLVEV